MRSNAGFIAVGLAAMILSGCSDDTVTGPEDPEAPVSPPAAPPVSPPTAPPKSSLGSLVAAAVTTGMDLDPNGYVIVMRDRTRNIGVNSVVTLATDLGPGSYQLELTDIAPNCAVAGDNPRTVVVSAGAVDRITFAVACQAFGTVEVTTVTTGQDVDPDGYILADYDGWRGWAMGANDTLKIRVYPGAYWLELTGIAPNCTVARGGYLVEAASAATVRISFEVACVAKGAP
jgi:hypothetical protein